MNWTGSMEKLVTSTWSTGFHPTQSTISKLDNSMILSVMFGSTAQPQCTPSTNSKFIPSMKTLQLQLSMVGITWSKEEASSVLEIRHSSMPGMPSEDTSINLPGSAMLSHKTLFGLNKSSIKLMKLWISSCKSTTWLPSHILSKLLRLSRNIART